MTTTMTYWTSYIYDLCRAVLKEIRYNMYYIYDRIITNT